MSKKKEYAVYEQAPFTGNMYKKIAVFYDLQSAVKYCDELCLSGAYGVYLNGEEVY